MTTKTWLIVVLLTCLPACRLKALYTDIQNNQRRECFKLPESEQEPCFASVELDYEEYQRQRSILNDQDNIE